MSKWIFVLGLIIFCHLATRSNAVSLDDELASKPFFDKLKKLDEKLKEKVNKIKDKKDKIVDAIKTKLNASSEFVDHFRGKFDILIDIFHNTVKSVINEDDISKVEEKLQALKQFTQHFNGLFEVGQTFADVLIKEVTSAQKAASPECPDDTSIVSSSTLVQNLNLGILDVN